MSQCPNCGKQGPHLVPAFCGEPAFWICDETAPTPEASCYRRAGAEAARQFASMAVLGCAAAAIAVGLVALLLQPHNQPTGRPTIVEPRR